MPNRPSAWPTMPLLSVGAAVGRGSATSYWLRSRNLHTVETMPPSRSSSASALAALVPNAGASQTMTLGFLSATKPQIGSSPRGVVWIFQLYRSNAFWKRFFLERASPPSSWSFSYHSVTAPGRGAFSAIRRSARVSGRPFSRREYEESSSTKSRSSARTIVAPRPRRRGAVTWMGNAVMVARSSGPSHATRASICPRAPHGVRRPGSRPLIVPQRSPLIPSRSSRRAPLLWTVTASKTTRAPTACFRRLSLTSFRAAASFSSCASRLFFSSKYFCAFSIVTAAVRGFFFFSVALSIDRT